MYAFPVIANSSFRQSRQIFVHSTSCTRQSNTRLALNRQKLRETCKHGIAAKRTSETNKKNLSDHIRVWCIYAASSLYRIILSFRTYACQGRIQEFAKGGRGTSHPLPSSSLPSSSLAFPLHLPFLFSPPSLRSRPLKPAREYGGALYKLPSGVRGGAPAENEFGAKAVTQPRVAIISNILSTMFYVLEEMKMAMVSP